LRRFYATGAREQPRSLLRVVIADLALELLGHRIERRADLLGVRRCPERLAGRLEYDLHVVRTAQAWVLLERDLDLAPAHLVLEPSESLKLVFGGSPHLLRDLVTSTFQHQLHARSFGRSRPYLESPPGKGLAPG
jgi:hypothetical protein